MKKHWIRGVAALACAALVCCCLAGCSSKRPKDGTYTARYRNPSGGFVEYLTVTFRDGKPTKAEFDAYRPGDTSSRKSQLTKEEYPMDPHPSEWMPLLSKNILSAGTDPNKIAAVAGATSSTGHARELYAAILKAAVKGDTAEIILENEKDPADSMSDSTGDMTGDSGTGLPDGSSDSMGSSGSESGSGSMGDSTDSTGSGGSTDSAGDASGSNGSSAADSNSGNNGSTEGVLPDSGADSSSAGSSGSSSAGSSDSGSSSAARRGLW